MILLFLQWNLTTKQFEIDTKNYIRYVCKNQSDKAEEKK